MSATYIFKLKPIWCRWFLHTAEFDADFALLNAGSNSAARMAIIAITTKSSMSVKPFR